MDKSKKLIIIGGPTASGKTSLALDLANELQSEIVSADSRQIYKELNIGVARPNQEELDSVPHHLIGHTSIFTHYDVSDFMNEARTCLASIFLHNDVAIMVGGTGMYIQAVLSGIDQIPDVPTEVRQNIYEQWQEEGLEALLKILRENDPEYYQKVDRMNPVRVMRALEVIKVSGRAFSSFHNQTKSSLPYEVNSFWLNPPREVLYQRINERVESMIIKGLESEVKCLEAHKNMKALQTVGYSEWWPYFDGKVTMAEVVENIKQNSRNYAKRQVTWFKNKGNYIQIEHKQDIIDRIFV